MLAFDTVKIKWHNKTRKYYEDKGYIFTKYEFVKSQGWKVFRIVGQRAVPTLKQLEDGINTLLNTDKNFIRIYLDDVKEAI